MDPYIKKKERAKINNVTSHFKGIGREERSPKLAEGSKSQRAENLKKRPEKQ